MALVRDDGVEWRARDQHGPGDRLFIWRRIDGPVRSADDRSANRQPQSNLGPSNAPADDCPNFAYTRAADSNHASGSEPKPSSGRAECSGEQRDKLYTLIERLAEKPRRICLGFFIATFRRP